MRDLIKIIQEAENEAKRIHRDAFLYLEGKKEKDQFAQCSTCIHWMPESERCALFSKSKRVVANASCALYVEGNPQEDQEFLNVVTPKDAGYVLGQVRCENCGWFEDDQCHLFKKLNDEMGDVWDLDTRVHAQACCNAWQEKS
jgi:hypothetical protein